MAVSAQKGKKAYIIRSIATNQWILKMPCYQLPDKHHASIAVYVQYALCWTDDQTQHLADKLKRCNVASVNFSYDLERPALKCKTDNFKMLDNKAYHGAVRCWGYNSGNDPKTPDFNDILAFLFSLVPDEVSIEKSIEHWVIY